MADRQRQGGLSIFSNMFARPDAPEMNEIEAQEVINGLRESDDERALQKKMGTGKYWTDAIKHLPAAFLARMKKLDPETGEVRWLGRAPEPDMDMVMRGVMTMDEWKEETAAAREYNEAGKNFHSTWVDDTKAMAAMPALINNAMGGDWEAPEFAMEAAGRVGEMQRNVQDDFGLDDPQGFPQHLMGGVGAMATQIPIPGTQGKGALAQMAKKIPAPIRAPAGAVAELVNPTINPSVGNYLKGSVASGALDTYLEPSSKDLSELAEMDRKQAADEDMFGNIETMVDEQWDDTPMETKLAVFSSKFAEATWEKLNTEQREEILQELQARGAFDDAE